MNKFIRFYNQNRHMVWIVILVVIAIIVLIQLLNQFAIKKVNENTSKNSINLNKDTINKNYSVITGEEVKQDIKDVIDEFVNLCNKKNAQNAYEILSKECKEILYPTLNDFEKNYYNKLFTTKKTAIVQAWITDNNKYIYRIDFVEDMLATGTSSKTSIVDYYTVIEENGEYKLNINKFIGKENINKQSTVNDVTINVKTKKVYMDYEIYDFEVVNNTNEEIIIANLKETNSVYVQDKNEVKYSWYNYEIIDREITIISGLKQEISIKFNKLYKPNNETIKIVFSNVMLKDNKASEIYINI